MRITMNFRIGDVMAHYANSLRVAMSEMLLMHIGMTFTKLPRIKRQDTIMDMGVHKGTPFATVEIFGY